MEPAAKIRGNKFIGEEGSNNCINVRRSLMSIVPPLEVGVDPACEKPCSLDPAQGGQTNFETFGLNESLASLYQEQMNLGHLL